MAFEPSPAWDPSRARNNEKRLLDMFVHERPDILLAGVPFDASVLGRKGCKHGPTAIRAAMRFWATHDPAGVDISKLRLLDLGDVAGMSEDVLKSHRKVRLALKPVFAHDKPVVLLGGDHGLTYPHVQALADHVDGTIGIVVIDAHYDLRSYDKVPSSGTPFRRILHELEGATVRPENLVEIGIRPYANTTELARYAAQQGVRIYSADDVRRDGIEAVTEAAIEAAGDGVDHLWVSVDIDGLDQSIAPGCSAPGPGGLLFSDAAHVVTQVARDVRCRAMDMMEVAPSFDPLGNTQRCAAGLVASFCGGIARR